MHILKAFVPAILEAGPLDSGKQVQVITTSSVVGLLNHQPGAYGTSKMAVTAVVEQMSQELQAMGEKAAHIRVASLHPSAAGTGFMNARNQDGSKGVGEWGSPTDPIVYDA